MQISLNFMLYCLYMPTKDKNFNQNKNGYCNSLDENFNTAIDMFEQNFTQNELINFLTNGNIPERQISALRLSKLETAEQAQILIRNLVGCDGKIREAVALKINELTDNEEFLQYFYSNEIYDVFLNAIIDINSNVCRNIISALIKMQINSNFCKYFTKELLKRTKSMVEIVKTFDFADGKYKVNKEVFKLYWYLETTYAFANKISASEIIPIVSETKNIEEYTIREKTAKILTAYNDKEFDEIKQELKNDRNYYVRRF